MVKKSILNDQPEILIAKYKKSLNEKGVDYEKVILFGSYSKGTAKPWSDIDLCIVSDKFGKNRHEERIMLMNIANDIEPMIEPHPYNPKDLNDTYDPIALEIKRTGKVV